MSRIRRSFLAKHWVTLLVAMVGAGLTVAVVLAGSARSLREAGEIMDRRALVVVEAVKRSVQAATAEAAGAAGLFVASEMVTESEFGAFAGSLGQQPRSLGLAYVPVVEEAELSDFLDGVRLSDPGYLLFSVGSDGERFPSQAGEVNYPLLYYVPGSEFDLDLRGFDTATDPVWEEVLDRAADREGVTVSPLTQLFGMPDLWGYMAVAPIVESDRVTGFAVSLARVDTLVEGELAESLHEVVSWSVSDVTAAATVSPSPDRLRRVEILEVGDRSWRVDVTPSDEARVSLMGGSVWPGVAFGLLATAAAGMAAHLGVGTSRSREESRELRRLAEEKDEFLAAISHELRTPLTVVVGMAEILEEAILRSDPDAQEYVSVLREQGTELARLVDDLLLLGRLDAEVLPVRPEVVDLTWEVERIIREVDALPHIRVLVTGSGVAWADPLRLRHVIRHLHTNALRYANSRVEYRIIGNHHETRLAVVDDGPGVSDSEMPHLFTAASGKKDTPGSPTSLGLGLRVSKRLAEAMGGDLSYQRVDSHTVFELWLPAVGDDEFAGGKDAIRLERTDVTA